MVKTCIASVAFIPFDNGPMHHECLMQRHFIGTCEVPSEEPTFLTHYVSVFYAEYLENDSVLKLMLHRSVIHLLYVNFFMRLDCIFYFFIFLLFIYFIAVRRAVFYAQCAYNALFIIFLDTGIVLTFIKVFSCIEYFAMRKNGIAMIFFPIFVPITVTVSVTLLPFIESWAHTSKQLYLKSHLDLLKELAVTGPHIGKLL